MNGVKLVQDELIFKIKKSKFDYKHKINAAA